MQRREKGARRRIYPLFLAVSAAGALWTQRANCATETWTASSGNWATAANWNSGAGPVPGSLDTADVTDSDGISRTITYNYTGSAVTLGVLDLNLTGGTGRAAETLDIPADVLTTGEENIGSPNNGVGVVDQTGGTNTVAGVGLFLGVGTGSSTGIYSLSGTGLLSGDGPDADEYVGYAGNGIVSQSGGTNRLTDGSDLYLGENGGSTGTYSLSGGLLSASVDEFIGNIGTGLFNQTGGINTITSPSGRRITP